jgi:hypothetical protein
MSTDEPRSTGSRNSLDRLPLATVSAEDSERIYQAQRAGVTLTGDVSLGHTGAGA